MQILIADDDGVTRTALEAMLRAWGCAVVVCQDGAEAWRALSAPGAPALAVLDWQMPGLDGLEVCRRVRQQREPDAPTYIILLTGNRRREDIVAGLNAGADDYIVKPFDPSELRARVQVGMRVVDLQRALAVRVGELEAALSKVHQLQGLLPICSYCKKIRDDQNYWTQVEAYVSRHADVQFSHGICPDCYAKIVAEEFGEAAEERPARTSRDAGSE
jgi:sigma-B regulation protein RsbU (phosphoserine phosphatase)